MADDTNADMTKRRGIVHGPRPLGALVPGVTRAAFRRHSPAAALIMADWPIIVGPKVASMTTPRRLDRGTLTIACAGPVAMNLHYVGVELINRINGHLGGQPGHSLRFTQAGMPRQAHPPPLPPPEAVDEAEAAVAGLPPGDLRRALSALGSVVLGRTRS
jgi:hypothetical protein